TKPLSHNKDNAPLRISSIKDTGSNNPVIQKRKLVNIPTPHSVSKASNHLNATDFSSSKNLFTINPGTLSACITSEKSSSMAVDAAIETLSPPFHSPSHFSPQRNFYLAVDRLHFMMDTLMDLLGLAGRRSGLPMVVCCSSRDELDAVCSAVANVPFISLASLVNFPFFFFHPHSVLLFDSVLKIYVHEQLMASKSLNMHRPKANNPGVSNIARSSYLVSRYTDLAEADCSLILEHFRQATMRWNPEVSVQPAVDSASVKDEQKSHMIVATDACLPLLAPGESPIAARVLINYELPTKKETYTRRMTTFLAGGLSYKVVLLCWLHINGVCSLATTLYKYMQMGFLEESGNLVIAEMPIHVSLSMLTFPTFCLATLFLSVSLA
ncbi:hypothetical protein DVH24_006603, partial [Malus domestica]